MALQQQQRQQRWRRRRRRPQPETRRHESISPLAANDRRAACVRRWHRWRGHTPVPTLLGTTTAHATPPHPSIHPSIHSSARFRLLSVGLDGRAWRRSSRFRSFLLRLDDLDSNANRDGRNGSTSASTKRERERKRCRAARQADLGSRSNSSQ